MRALFAIAAMLLTTLASPDARAQRSGLRVTPVVIEMPQERGFASLRVHNGRDQEIAFEIEAFLWTQNDGESVLTPTRDLVLAPSTFLTPAGGDQIVRVALPPALRHGATEQSYRLVLRELPNPEAPPINGFRLVVEMSMPLFVTPRGARGTLMTQVVRNGAGERMLVLRNTGAARLVLSDAPPSARVSNLPRYLLAGAQATRSMPHGTIEVMAATAGDVGPHIETLGADDAAALADAR